MSPHGGAGPKVAFADGLDYNDYTRAWEVLDKEFAKHLDMVLLRAGSPKGAEFIAARYADAGKASALAYWSRVLAAGDRRFQRIPAV